MLQENNFEDALLVWLNDKFSFIQNETEQVTHYTNLEKLNLALSSLEHLLQFPVYRIQNIDVTNKIAQVVIFALQSGLKASTVGLLVNGDILTDDQTIIKAYSDFTIKTVNIYKDFMKLYSMDKNRPIYKNMTLIGALIILNSFNEFIEPDSLVPRDSYDFHSVINKISDMKKLEGFDIVHYRLCDLLLTFLNDLHHDFKRDFYKESNLGKELVINDDIDKINILAEYSSSQRFGKICSENKLFQVLQTIAIIFCRKAFHLKQETLKVPQSNSVMDNSNSYNEFNLNESSSDEDGNLLGFLFKDSETKGTGEKVNVVEETPNDDMIENSITTIINVYSFMLRVTENEHINIETDLKIKIDIVQLHMLSWLLVDVDQEILNSSKIKDDKNWFLALQEIILNARNYLHNLIFSDLLNNEFQLCLLNNLGISPWLQENSIWKSDSSPYLLPILIQILLKLEQQDREVACLSIWRRFLSNLINFIFSAEENLLIEDVNIEHAYILVYIFHLMNLMQKKDVLLILADGIIRCNKISLIFIPEMTKDQLNQKVLIIGRLLMFLEYMLQHLYTSPAKLQKYVETILCAQKIKPLDDSDVVTSYLDSHTKYYSLFPTKKNKTSAKLDGLAWNFIICTPEKLKYSTLIESLITILQLPNYASKYDMDFSNSCKYTVFNSWRLLQILPPSTIHVDNLLTLNEIRIYEMLWFIRALYPNTQIHYLFVNSLVKQVSSLSLSRSFILVNKIGFFLL